MRKSGGEKRRREKKTCEKALRLLQLQLQTPWPMASGYNGQLGSESRLKALATILK